jgi:hypothetical protein
MSTHPADSSKNSVDSGVARSSAYERPTLKTVGNLYDLLAGGGTQDSDPGNPCITPAGLSADATCGG